MCCVLIISVGVTSVRVADRLIIFPYQLAHFLGSQLADYCTYNMVDLLLYSSILVSATHSFFSFKSTDAKQPAQLEIEQILPPKIDAITFALASVAILPLWDKGKRFKAL